MDRHHAWTEAGHAWLDAGAPLGAVYVTGSVTAYFTIPLLQVYLEDPALWYLCMEDPCDEFQHERIRPPEPTGEDVVWYRGWEVGWDRAAEYWSGHGWGGYKGGCDIGAPQVSAGRYQACLDEIDEQEDE